MSHAATSTAATLAPITDHRPDDSGHGAIMAHC
jgi:hypothetical protein